MTSNGHVPATIPEESRVPNVVCLYDINKTHALFSHNRNAFMGGHLAMQCQSAMLRTHLHLVQMSRMMAIHLHSPIHLNGAVLN